MIYTLFIIMITLQASSDALRDNGAKIWSKRLELMSWVFAACLIPMSEYKEWNYVAALAILYTLIRWYLFDFIYNKIRRLNANFIGTTSPTYDKFMKRLSNWQFWLMKSILLGLSVFWYVMIAIKRLSI